MAEADGRFFMHIFTHRSGADLFDNADGEDKSVRLCGRQRMGRQPLPDEGGWLTGQRVIRASFSQTCAMPAPVACRNDPTVSSSIPTR
jgi:hypothetical protein